ncbi:type II secretion system F family protein [Candidatus Micrarchaeota archaeon]|nr:type II secretion system F family protein [Candidatus Micrarchaeota archaeon]
MPVDPKTLARIKELVEEEKVEESTGDEDLKKAIERLKKKEEPEPTKAEAKKVEFKKVDLPATGVFGTVGKLYTSFGSLFNTIAQTFATMPIGQTISADLEAAGMKIKPEAFLVTASAVSLIIGIFVFLLFVLIAAMTKDALFGILAPLMAVCAFIMAAFVALSYPKSVSGQRASQVDRSLPFALRQVSTQVKAGVSFHKAMQSIASSNYGILSEEFTRVVNEVNSGETMQAALMKLSRRTRSKGLKRTVTQILRSFKSGGNLSQIISDIADDVSFESRMNIRDFTEKLNFVNVIYIMVGVVAPVTLAILSSIMQIPLFAGGIPPLFIYFGFAGILGIMVAILYVTKKMEPAAW